MLYLGWIQHICGYFMRLCTSFTLSSLMAFFVSVNIQNDCIRVLESGVHLFMFSLTWNVGLKCKFGERCNGHLLLQYQFNKFTSLPLYNFVGLSRPSQSICCPTVLGHHISTFTYQFLQVMDYYVLAHLALHGHDNVSYLLLWNDNNWCLYSINCFSIRSN